MKLNTKLAIALVAATTSVFGLGSGAMAGEGGAAGAASFTVEADKVTGVAVASAVGKNDASAYAYNDVTGKTNTASALGSAGFITSDKIGDKTNAQMKGSAEGAATLGTQQANKFTSSANITLGTGDADKVVDVTGIAP